MKTRTIIVIILVFIAGGAIGALITGQTYKCKVKRIKEHRKPAVFKEHMHEMLNTTDEQKLAIDSVFADYLPRIRETRDRNKKEIRALHDTMLTNVRLHLNEEQIEKMEEFKGKFMKHKRHGKRHHHKHKQKE